MDKFSKDGMTYLIGDTCIEQDAGGCVLVVDLIAVTADGWKKPIRKRIPLGIDLLQSIYASAEVAKPVAEKEVVEG